MATDPQEQTNPLSSFFFGNVPGGRDALEMRRRIAERLAAQRRPFPNTVGQGLTYLGESLGERMQLNQLDAAERIYQEAGKAEAQKLQQGAPQQAAPYNPYPNAPSATPPAAAAPPLARPPAAAPQAPPVGAGTPLVPKPVRTIPIPGDAANVAPPVVASGGDDSGVPSLPTGADVGNPVQVGGQDASSPDVRAAVARALLEGGTAPGVPQPNPTEAGPEAPLTLDGTSAPDGGPVRVASLDPSIGIGAVAPAEAAGNRPIVMPDIAPAPQAPGTTQVAGDVWAGVPAAGVLGASSPGAPGPQARPAAPGAPDAVPRAIPGPFDPRPPVPQGKGITTTPLDPRYTGDVVYPTPPKPTPLTDEEIRANSILMNPYFVNDPNLSQIAKNLAAVGAAKRGMQDAQNKELYDKELAKVVKQAEEQKTQSLERPQKDFEFAQAQQKAAIEEARQQKYGAAGEPAWREVITKSAEAVKGLPANYAMMNRAQAILDGDPKMFTGSLAERQMDLSKFLTAVGWQGKDPRVPATEQFRSYIASAMGQLRGAIVGPGSQSEAEMALLQRASAGDIKLEPETMKAIVNALQSQTLQEAIRHQQRLEYYGGTDKGDLAYAYGNHSLPMETMVPQHYVDALRADKDPNARKNFDDAFHTPGLADKILQLRKR